MRELLKRSLTGIIYVFLLVSSVYLSNDAFDFLFLIFGITCIYEFKKLIRLQGYYIFIAFLAIWWVFIYLLGELSHQEILRNILLAVTLVVNLLLSFNLFKAKIPKYNNTQKFIITISYIGGGSIFLTMIPYNMEHFFAKSLIIGVFILIWVSDSFAYLVGKAIGKNKLFPSVSPKKTIEGFFGGFIFALIAAYLLSLSFKELTSAQWLILAAVLVITGSVGDLIESKFKRLAGVKDSGAILPGHGGLLDRLDSLIFAAPFAYLTLQIYSYVP